jgi:hypothetical protein
MKKVLTEVVIALLVILSYAAGRQYTARLSTTNLGGRRVLYWVDPMHPSYKSDRPGIAPDCGMALEPVYADDSNHARPSAGAAHLPPGGVVINRSAPSTLTVANSTTITVTLNVLSTTTPGVLNIGVTTPIGTTNTLPFTVS